METVITNHGLLSLISAKELLTLSKVSRKLSMDLSGYLEQRLKFSKECVLVEKSTSSSAKNSDKFDAEILGTNWLPQICVDLKKTHKNVYVTYLKSKNATHIHCNNEVGVKLMKKLTKVYGDNVIVTVKRSETAYPQRYF